MKWRVERNSLSWVLILKAYSKGSLRAFLYTSTVRGLSLRVAVSEWRNESMMFFVTLPGDCNESHS